MSALSAFSRALLVALLTERPGAGRSPVRSRAARRH